MTNTGGNPGVGVDSHGGAVIDPTANVISLVEAGMRRQDDLRELESSHLRELIAVENRHAEELRVAEAKRIDAIRAVDVQALQQASKVATEQANTLAAQVATSAETLRTTVAAAALQQAAALQTNVAPLADAIADLRRSQYELQGQRIQRSDSRNAGIDGRAMIALGFSTVLFVLSVAGFIVALTR